MRPLLAITALTWLGFSLGCIALTDDRGQIALDYEIDRVRIPAIRLTPPAAVEGEEVLIEALVLSPSGVDSIAFDICALDPDVPSNLWGVDCFSNAELVVPIASENPAPWTVPLVGQDCVEDTASDTGGIDRPCSSRVPVRVTAFSGEERGMASLQLQLLRSAPEDLAALADARTELTYEGNAQRGEDIGLVYRIDWDGDLDFRWYVDAGELHHTGRTATTWLQGDRHTTRNQLAIPTGYVGPLRVVVVARDTSWADGNSGNVTWDVLTLEVE